MQTVAIRHIKPLMTLAEPVENFDGQLLLSKGAVLTNNHIKNLKAWGVTEVAILDESQIQRPSSKPKEIDPEKLSAIQSKMEKLFRHANLDHPATKEMLRLATLNNLKT